MKSFTNCQLQTMPRSTATRIAAVEAGYYFAFTLTTFYLHLHCKLSLFAERRRGKSEFRVCPVCGCVFVGTCGLVDFRGTTFVVAIGNCDLEVLERIEIPTTNPLDTLRACSDWSDCGSILSFWFTRTGSRKGNLIAWELHPSDHWTWISRVLLTVLSPPHPSRIGSSPVC